MKAFTPVKSVKYLVLVGLFLLCYSAKATNYVLNTSGSWSTSTNWLPNGHPGAGDNVTIGKNLTVNITANEFVANITFDNTTGTGTINFSGNFTLTVSGNITTTNPALTNAFTGNNTLQVVSLAGSVTVPAGSTTNIGGITFTQAAGQSFTVSGTVNFNNTTGTKTIGNMTINSTGVWANSVAETVSVQNLTVVDGGVINGSASVTINVANTFNTNASTVGNKSTLGNCILTVTGTTTINGYLLFSSTTGTKTFNNTITVNGAATWDNTIGVACVVNCSIANSGSWTVPSSAGGYTVNTNGQTYTYSSTGSTTIVMGSLTISGTSTVTNTGNLQLSSGTTALTLSAAGRFNNGTGSGTPYLSLSNCNTCVSVSGGGTVDFSKTGNQVDYSSALAASQTVFGTTYYTLSASNSSAATLAAATAVTNLVNLSGSSSLSDGGFALTGAANLTMAGTSNLSFSTNGTLPQLTGATNSLASGTSMSFSGNCTLKSSATYPYQTININGGTSNFSNVTNVAVDLNFGGGAMSNNAVMTVGGTFNYNSGVTTTLANNITTGSLVMLGGTLNYSGVTITINGTNGIWNYVNFFGAAFTTNGTSTVVFTSGANQKINGSWLGIPIGSATTFQNLTINNPNGVTLDQVNATVAGTLTFTSGNIITGSNVLSVASGGTVSQTSGFVDGNLQKAVPTGNPVITFEVGKGTTYAPLSLSFTNVTGAGNVTCTNTAGQHPSIGASSINPSKDVNRYWSITNNATTFTSYNATFNFVAGDVLGGANTANFQIYRYDNSSNNWFSTTIGARTATSSQFTGEVFANLPSGTKEDFAIGEIIPTTSVFSVATGNWSNKATWIQNRTGTIAFTNLSASVTGVGTSFLTELAVGDVLILQATPTVVRGTVLSISTNTSLTLVVPATATTASLAYGRQYIPNTINDVVTIGNTNNAGATTITLDMNATVNSLNINTGVQATAQVLTHSGTNALTVQSNVKIYHPTGNVTDAWNINAGSATVGGALTIGSADNTNNTRIAQVNITTGTLSVANLIFSAANTNGREVTTVLNMAGSTGSFNLSGAILFSNNRGLLQAGTAGSTFNFNGTAAQTLVLPSANLGANVWSYNNVWINNAAGVTCSTTIPATNLTGDFRVQSGTFIQTGGSSITGNGGTTTFFVGSGAQYRMTGTQGLPTGFTTYSFNATSTTEFSQSTSISVASRSYGNLYFNSTAIFPTFSLPNGAISANNLTLGDGESNFLLSLQGSGTTALTLAGNLTINGATFLSNTGITSITMAGNWTDNSTIGAYTDTGSTIVFNGSGTQTISSVSGNTDTFFNLTINTSAATNSVQLLDPILVSNTLTLTQGGLDLNGNTLSVTRNATGAISRSGGYVKSEKTSSPYSVLSWTISNATGSFVFPFGKSSTEYIPFTFNITAAGTVGSGTGTVSVYTYPTAVDNTPYPSGVSNLNGSNNGQSVADRFWVITPSYATQPTANVTFTIVNTEVTSVSPGPPLNAQRWSPAGYWDAALAAPVVQTYTANTPAANTSQVVVSNLNQFSPWALASTAAPLPVQLTSFTATPKSYGVELDWVTKSELNNDYFSILRSSSSTNFEVIGSVKGNGTTNTAHSYAFMDLNPKIGENYYQLSQTDFDGKVTRSEIIAVNVLSLDPWVSIYPNPVSQKQALNVEINTLQPNTLTELQISNLQGVVVFGTEMKTNGEGVLKASLAPGNLSSGLYILTVHGVHYKIIVE